MTPKQILPARKVTLKRWACFGVQPFFWMKHHLLLLLLVVVVGFQLHSFVLLNFRISKGGRGYGLMKALWCFVKSS